MPNTLAYVALLIWPAIALGLFRTMPVERATIWSILGAYLLLPPLANFDPPLVPTFDKTSIPNLAAYAICVFVLGLKIPLLPRAPLGRLLMILFVASPFLTVLTNADPIWFATGGLPGLRPLDSFAMMVTQATAVLPFFLARSLLATERAQREILLALMVGGLAYSIPMLIEIRLSPQINVWVYGFFQHDFIQMMRYGGFRPIVFLPHALWVAFFAFMALVAAAALAARGPKTRRPLAMGATVYLAGVLVLCKTAGALIYATAFVPIAALAGARLQILLAAALGATALCYPLLRGADLAPVEAIVEQAAQISPERARSLQFRIDNENVLLERASERPVFGWGIWGRNHIHDPVTGELRSTIDGRWILTIGVFGWLGYVVEFGLLSLPLFLLARASLGRKGAELSPYIGPIALILGVNMLDMLPNATLIPFTWLLAGATLGYAERLAERSRPDATAAGPEPTAEPVGPRTIL